MRYALLLCCLAMLAACHSPQQVAATPQRPTVSFDTNTTAIDTFEIETGLTVDPDDSLDTATTLKYGAGEQTELFIGWSPRQVIQLPGPDVRGPSDVVLGTRHQLWAGDADTPSAAVVVTGKLPTASRSNGLSSGEIDLRFGAILNHQFGSTNANAFYQYGALGNAAGAGTISEHTGTLTAGWSINDRIGSFVELAGVAIPSQNLESLFVILGATYAASTSTILDAGVTVGLSTDAPDLQLFVGLTHNFGRPTPR